MKIRDLLEIYIKAFLNFLWSVLEFWSSEYVKNLDLFVKCARISVLRELKETFFL